MFGSKSKEIARLDTERHRLAVEVEWKIGEVNSLETKVENLGRQLSSSKEQCKLWSEDYRQLNDRYTLLDSLLKQLRVNVTLPAKKIARQN